MIPGLNTIMNQCRPGVAGVGFATGAGYRKVRGQFGCMGAFPSRTVLLREASMRAREIPPQFQSLVLRGANDFS
jgi:hypothetical protein